jgi:hypothetical protein
MKFLKKTKMQITFKRSLLRTTSATDKYETTGIYKLTCLDSNNNKEIRRTVGTITYIRYKGHTRNKLNQRRIRVGDKHLQQHSSVWKNMLLWIT